MIATMIPCLARFERSAPAGAGAAFAAAGFFAVAVFFAAAGRRVLAVGIR